MIAPQTPKRQIKILKIQVGRFNQYESEFIGFASPARWSIRPLGSNGWSLF